MNNTTNRSILLNCTACVNTSQLDVDSSIDWTVSQTTVVTLTLVNSLCSVFGVLGNVLVLLVITRNPIFRSVSDFLIFSLSLADLIVAAIYVPLFISHIVCYQELKENAIFSTVKSFVGHLALLASIASIVGITIDRLTAICWPLRYPKLLTKKFAFTFIFIAWLISAVMATSYAFFEPNRVFLACYCMTLLLATILMYSYILKIAHDQRKRIISMRYQDEEYNQVNQQQPGDTQMKRKYAKTLKGRKAGKTFAIVVGVFLITWIPLLVYTMTASPSKTWFYEGFLWAECFSLWNSFINPYIYFARSRRYRIMALNMLGLRQWFRTRRIAAETSRATTVLRQAPVTDVCACNHES